MNQSYDSLLEVRRQFDFAVQSVVDSITCYCSNPLSDFPEIVNFRQKH